MLIKRILILLSVLSLSAETFAGTVILKADDFGRGSGWDQFLLYVVNNDIPVNIGIIVSDISNERKIKTRDLIKWMAPHEQQFAFFYHGHDHNCDIASSIFLTGSGERQSKIINSDLRALFSIGIVTTAFGGPCNHGNKYTGLSLESNGFKQWLLPYVRTTGFNGETFTNRVNIESTPGKINISNFLKELDDFPENYNDTIVLQFHPGMWKTGDMNSFERAISAINRKNWSYRLLK
ncbi:hypothetical protein [Thalassolituus sp.]|jgi:hypothetical protein|uniref:hypothetical protein n=1 Tax=Thalassolituus sp. TaxID=2030822 RepID=UPI0032D8CE73